MTYPQVISNIWIIFLPVDLAKMTLDQGYKKHLCEVRTFNAPPLKKYGPGMNFQATHVNNLCVKSHLLMFLHKKRCGLDPDFELTNWQTDKVIPINLPQTFIKVDNKKTRIIIDLFLILWNYCLKKITNEDVIRVYDIILYSNFKSTQLCLILKINVL